MKELTVRMLLNSCVRSQIDINNMTIIYRTYDPDGNDVFAGMCKYHDGELVPCDHDTYSLDDKIIDYQMYHNEAENKWELAVWYESNWMEG